MHGIGNPMNYKLKNKRKLELIAAQLLNYLDLMKKLTVRGQGLDTDSTELTSKLQSGLLINSKLIQCPDVSYVQLTSQGYKTEYPLRF
jgi:hypothetical protein